MTGIALGDGVTGGMLTFGDGVTGLGNVGLCCFVRLWCLDSMHAYILVLCSSHTPKKQTKQQKKTMDFVNLLPWCNRYSIR